MEPTSKRVTGADRNGIRVLEWSDEGVPLLLLHGFGNEAHIWDDFAPAVAPYYRTLALDHRGHGESDRVPEGQYSYEAMARDVEALTAALGIDRLVVVGHSLGGRVATVFVDRNPERIAGLVLVDIGPELDARGSTRIRMDVEINQDPTFSSHAEYARALTLAYPEAQPQALERMALHGLRQRDDGLYELKMDPALRSSARISSESAADDDGGLSQEYQWEALARVACPTLVVRGAASDILSADTAEKMAEEVLPNGRLAVVARAGHSVMTDNPEGFEAALAGFLLSEE
ncbi:MAG: alpha/beta fold hydrolase [Myxococcota bacterium]